MQDVEGVNEFLCLNSYVKFSSNIVHVACCLYFSKKKWNMTKIVTCMLLTSNQMIFPGTPLSDIEFFVSTWDKDKWDKDK